MRSRAGSWDRKEGSHLQSLDPSRVALLESRSSTTITSAIVVGRLVPLELRRFGLGSGRGCASSKEVAVAGAKSPDLPAKEEKGAVHRAAIRRPRDAATDRPTQTKWVSKWASQ